MASTAAAAAALSSSSCSEYYGWLAAAVSVLFGGSFAVPIKSAAALSVDADPLVFQSYKTAMVLVVAAVLLVVKNGTKNGNDFHFTAWGLVSAAFWVPAGCLTVYAVKRAGLAISMGLISAVIVLVGFFWGMVVFREPLHNVPVAFLAVLLICLGLAGMSYYSDNSNTNQKSDRIQANSSTDNCGVAVQGEKGNTLGNGVIYEVLEGNHDDNPSRELGSSDDCESSVTLALQRTLPDSPTNDTLTSNEQSCEGGIPSDSISQQSPLEIGHFEAEPVVFWVCGGVTASDRCSGLLAATLCGVLAGSMYAPMKWSSSDVTQGAAFFPSFAVGAAVVTVILWLLRWLNLAIRLKSFAAGFSSLPSFHFSVLWLPGCTAGVLYSIGNVAEWTTVEFLGDAVGLPVLQASMLVSGLWGLFYFDEVATGAHAVTCWFLSSVVTLVGIVLLGYEHHKTKG